MHFNRILTKPSALRVIEVFHILTLSSFTCLSSADPELRHWRKAKSPVLALPPSNNLTGFRDPFVLQRGGHGKEWIILVGSGIRDVGGAVLVYRSDDLTSGTCAGKQH